MNSVHKALLQSQCPLLFTLRFRGKINIQKPRAPHFERQLLIDLSKPVFGPPKYTLPEIALCDKGINKYQKEEIDNPFERILARECHEWMSTSKMVIFFHMNAISMEIKFPLYAELKRNKMTLRVYGKKIVKMATTGTPYESVNKLFVSHQNILFGQPENIGKMFKILRRAPQMVIMAGLINDRFMSKDELVQYSKLPNLQTAQSQLCAVLESAGSCIVNQLQQSQVKLVSHLDQHVKQQTETATTEKATSESEKSD